MAIKERKCFEINEKLNNYNITGFFLLPEERIEEFEGFVKELFSRSSYMSNQKLNLSCRKRFPEGEFHLKAEKEMKASGEKRTNHESQGVIRFFHTSGTPRRLFGSSITHQNTITMEICHASEKRKLNHDSIFPENVIVTAELSKAQFSDMITSFGMADGVPCTLHYTELYGQIEGKNDYEDKKATFQKEFDEKLANTFEVTNECISNAEELLQKKSLNKKDREALLSCLHKISNEIGTNSSYVAKCFAEQMEKTVHEAKKEVEAFMEEKVRNIASETISVKKENEFLLKTFD